MKKLHLTKCKICNKEVSERGFSFHVSNSHNIKIEDYIVKYEYKGIFPTCKCGCGNKITIRSYCVMDFVGGHAPTTQFKVGLTPTRNRESWLKNLSKSIQEYNKKEKEKNPNYRNKANNNAYGKKHSKETKAKLKNIVEQQIKDGKHPFLGRDNGRIKKSSLEIKFENYLKTLNIEYIPGFKISFTPKGKGSIRYKYYDFFVPKINSVIEIHGSYWHPQKKEGLNKIQLKNLKNDEFKKKLAIKNSYKIIVIYDYELDFFIEKNFLFNIIKEDENVHTL